MVLRLDTLITWLKRYGFTVGMLILALGIGFFSSKNAVIPVLMFGGMVYFLIMFTRPLWAYMFMILVLCSCFGFISDHSFSVAGVFKLRDFCLFSLFPFILCNVVTDRQSVKHLKASFNKYVLLLLIFIAFVMCYTTFRYNVSLLSTIRLARKYFFYSIYFVFLYYIQTAYDLKQFLKWLYMFAIIAAILYLTQFTVGLQNKILPNLLMVYQNLAGLAVPRIYFKGAMSLLFLCFSLSFWSGITAEEKKKRNLFILLSILFGIPCFLGFSRARWFMQFMIIFVPFLFTNNNQRVHVLKLSVIFGSILFFVVLLLHNTTGFNILSLLSKIKLQMLSAYFDLINQTGTFAFRLEDSAFRIELFLENRLMGIGFLHHLAAEESYKAAFVRDFLVETIDSGLLSLLTTTGICGLIVFNILVLSFFKHCIKLLKSIQTPLFRGLILGCLGYCAGGYMGFITLPFFTTIYEIPFIAIAFAIVAKISQFQTQEE